MARRKSEKKYYARRPFKYNGEKLARGQVFELIGARNDEKLVGLGYVGEVDPSIELYAYEDTGIEFVGIRERNAYGDAVAQRRNLERYGQLTPEMEDQLAEQEMQQAEPLHVS